jgi:hypothetical protein
MGLRERAHIFAARRNLSTVDMRQNAGVAVMLNFRPPRPRLISFRLRSSAPCDVAPAGTGTVEAPPFAGAASRWLRSASAFCRALISAAWLLLLAGASAVFVFFAPVRA